MLILGPPFIACNPILCLIHASLLTWALTGTCTYTASNKETVRGSVTDYWEETAGSPGRHITDCDIPAETAPACPIYTLTLYP